MRLAHDSDPTYGLLPWAISPRVWLGRVVIVVRPQELYECDLAFGRYPNTQTPTVILSSLVSDGYAEIQLYQHFDEGDWNRATDVVNLVEAMGSALLDDLLILGFREIERVDEHRSGAD